MNYDRGQRERDAHINDARRQVRTGGRVAAETIRGLIDGCVQLERRAEAAERQLRGGTHPLFIHPGGEKCVYVTDADGKPLPGWFVPYDVGGEGVPCELAHPTDECEARINEVREGYARRYAADAVRIEARDDEWSAKVAALETQLRTMDHFAETAERVEARNNELVAERDDYHDIAEERGRILKRVAGAVEKKHRHGEWQLRTAVLEALDGDA